MTRTQVFMDESIESGERPKGQSLEARKSSCMFTAEINKAQ